MIQREEPSPKSERPTTGQIFTPAQGFHYEPATGEIRPLIASYLKKLLKLKLKFFFWSPNICGLYLPYQ
jgi:hypothetical protein